MTAAFHYDISWRTGSQYPGRHKSWHGGGGLELRGHTPLLAASDARRIDLLASLKDPLERWIARTYRQRSAIALYVVADLSASMGVSGRHRKLNVLADFTEAAAQSAYRSGDAFGFLGADEITREAFWIPATRARGTAAALAKRLRAFVPSGTSANGLAEAAAWLPRRQTLVFLVSDFHFPFPRLEILLDSLARHAIVPVVLWDRAEFAPRPGFRINVVRDPETGHTRMLLLRPALQRAIAAAFRERYELLCNQFTRRSLRPLLLVDGFRAERVTEYFAGGRTVSLSQLE